MEIIHEVSKAPQAASLRANTTNSTRYLVTIVSNRKLGSGAPTFDNFYKQVSQCFSSPGLLVKYSFYELQPTTFKLHVHAIVDCTKSTNAYKHNYFKKILGKGYKTDFNEIAGATHLINCFNYSKGVPQQYIHIVYSVLKDNYIHYRDMGSLHLFKAMAKDVMQPPYCQYKDYNYTIAPEYLNRLKE